MFSYKGFCYFCEQKENITKTPVGGTRLCENCLREIGVLFLEFIEKSKSNDWENLGTKELLGKILNIVGNSSLGTYYLLQE